MSGRMAGPRALGEAVAALTRPIVGKRGFVRGGLIAEWVTIVGERLAASSLPERVSYPPKQSRGGTLHLRVASGSLAMELQHLEPELIERINGYFGYDAIGRVRLIQGPLPQTAPAATRPLPPRALDRSRGGCAGRPACRHRRRRAACGTGCARTRRPGPRLVVVTPVPAGGCRQGRRAGSLCGSAAGAIVDQHLVVKGAILRQVAQGVAILVLILVALAPAPRSAAAAEVLAETALGNPNAPGYDPRVLVADLPPLRRLPPRHPAQGQGELHRHRQGSIRLPRLPSGPAGAGGGGGRPLRRHEPPLRLH